MIDRRWEVIAGEGNSYITLTTDNLLWPCFLDDRSRLKILLHTAAQACPERSRFQPWP